MTQGFNDVRFPKKGITPKVKAELMVLAFAEYVDGTLPQTITDNCVQCAIIAVEEILHEVRLHSVTALGERDIEKFYENVLTNLKAMQ